MLGHLPTGCLWCSIILNLNSSRACSGWQEAEGSEKDRELFLASEFHTGLTPGWLGNVHFARYPLHVVSKIICMDPCSEGSASLLEVSSLHGRHSGGNPLQHPVRSDGVDSGPHEQCGSTTSLDDHCLVAGISCWLQNISPEVLQRLLETILTRLRWKRREDTPADWVVYCNKLHK